MASYTLAFALQLRKKHGKTSVRVTEECWYTYYQNAHVTKPIHTHPHITKPIHTHPHLTKPTHTHPHLTKPTHTHPHLTKPAHFTPTHYKTHTYTPTHYETHTSTHPHITKQFKTTTVQVKTITVQEVPKLNSHNIIKYPQYKVNGTFIHKNFTVMHFTLSTRTSP